ncbi:MAG TPA: hypothetical protein VF184_00255, partial [Phycisphaeraceae bacterium]
MSTLTKAFVVLVTVLSILLVAVVVPFVARTQDLQSQLQATNSALNAAEQKARQYQAEITAAQDRVSEQVAGLNA